MLSALGVRFKLMLLVIPFAALAVFLVAQLSYHQYQSLASLRHESRLADVASLSAELIDTLQTERGLSNGYLSGAGPLPPSLQEARGKTDAAFNAFAAAAGDPEAADLKLDSQAAAARATLAGRADIDARKTAAPAAFAAYTQAIRQLMDITGTLQNATSDGLLLRYSTALSHLLCVKEMAGRERGFVNGVLAKGAFDQPKLAQALGMKAAQEACQTQMLELAPPPMRDKLGGMLQSSAMQELQAMRDGLYALPLGQPAAITPAQWFAKATARIVELKQGQTRLLTELKEAIETQAEDYRRLLISELSALSVMTLLLALGGRAIYRSIHNPVVALEALMTGMSQDLARRAGLAGKDEIARMGKALDHLLDAFVATLASVSQGSEKLLGAAGALQGVSSRAAAAAEDQSNSSTEIAAAVEELTVGIQSVSDNTQDNLRIAQDMQNGVTQGRAQMQATTDAIARTAVTVVDAEKLIVSLAEKSQNIRHIITAIRDIADQTNLLALNAAIEAARAGEMGRGFAVVADEVRKLAERTGQETVQIASLIESITSETQDAAARMLLAREEMEDGTRLIADTLRELDEMHLEAKGVADKSHETAVAMSQQSSVSNDVAVNISKIAALAEDNSAMIQEVAELAHTLNHTAQELAEQVQRFHFGATR